jgi:hypothetical protein
MASAHPDHRSLEVVDEVLLEFFPRVDGVWLEAFKPRERRGLHSHREVESFGGVGSPRNFNSNRVATNPLTWVLLTVVLGDSVWFEILWIGLVGDAGGEGGEAVAVIVIVVPAVMIPSSRFSDKSCIVAFIDLLPKVDRGSVIEVGLD